MPRRVYLAGPPFAEEYRRRADPLVRALGWEPVDPDAARLPRPHGGPRGGDRARRPRRHRLLRRRARGLHGARRGHVDGGLVRPRAGQARRRLHRRRAGRTRGRSTSPTRCTPTSRTPSPRSVQAGRMSDARVVVGAGAMGAAAARVLAERGWAVTLLEQHAIGHDLGGSGHDTRSFRLSHSTPTTCGWPCARSSSGTTSSGASGETLLRRNGLLQRGSVVPPMAAALREAGVALRRARPPRRVAPLPGDAPAARCAGDLPARRRGDPRAPLDRAAGAARGRGGRRRARGREVHRARAAGRRRARLHAPAADRRRRRRRVRRAVVAAAARPARPAPAAAGRSRPGHLVPQPATRAGSSARA